MKIILCIKQIPDTTDIKWTENNTICRDGLESVINPYDVYSVENALHLRNICEGAEITAFSMGPLQAENMLRKTLALGIDNAVLLCDKKFAGSDTYATAKTISSGISKLVPDFDLIICGQFATDGDTAQTGPSIANFLDIPQVTFVREIIDCSNREIVVKRELSDGEETVKVTLPALICVLKNEKEPTRATINGIKSASKKSVVIKSAEDLGISSDSTGIKGSPTFVSKAFRAKKREKNCEFTDNIDKLAEAVKFNGDSENE